MKEARVVLVNVNYRFIRSRGILRGSHRLFRVNIELLVILWVRWLGVILD